jgi:hypothetical protein
MAKRFYDTQKAITPQQAEEYVALHQIRLTIQLHSITLELLQRTICSKPLFLII